MSETTAPVSREEEPPRLDSASATRQQIRGSSLLLAGRLLSLALNLVTQVLIVRTLAKADYGAFAYALSLTTTAAIVVTLGHHRIISRFLSLYEERREHDKLFGTLVMEAGMIAGLGIVLFLAVLGINATPVGDALIADAETATVLAILILFAPLEGLDHLAEATFAVFSEPRAIFTRKYVVAPLLRLAAVLGVAATGAGVVALAAAYVIAGAVGVALYAVLLVRVLRARGLLGALRPRRLVLPFREVFGFATPLLTAELVVISMDAGTTAMLGFFGGAVDVAALRAVRPAAILNQFVMRSFILLFLPLASRLYARDDREGMAEAYWRTAVWLAVLSFPVYVATGPLAEPVTVLLFGERYRDSAPLLAVLATGYYLNVSLGFNMQVLQVAGRVRYLAFANVAIALLNIGLGLALIPRLGAAGAAISNSVTLVMQNVMNQIGLGRELGGGLFRRRVARVYATILVAGALLWGMELLAEPSLLVGIPAAALVTAGLIAVNHREMRMGEVFPELQRIPVARRLFA